MNADFDPWSACIRLKGSHHLSIFMYSFSERCSIPSCIRIYIYVVVMANHGHVVSP